jgi:hypothetical protein
MRIIIGYTILLKEQVDHLLQDIINDINLKDKSNLSLKEMLSHQSGLFPWIPFYKKTIDSITNKPLSNWFTSSKIDNYSIKVTDNLFLKETFLDSINNDIINSELSNDKSYVYSDLPYYFMKEYLENKNFHDLDFQIKKKFFFN